MTETTASHTDPPIASCDDPSAAAAQHERDAAEETDVLPADIEEAMEAARGMLARRYAGKPNAPKEVFYVQACGEHIVLAPPSLTAFQTVLRTAADPQKKHKAADMMIANTIFWMRGQPPVSGRRFDPTEALKQFRAVQEVKILLDQQVAGLLFEALNESAGEPSLKKQ